MALTRTMGQLKGLCQRRADKENDAHVDSDEWAELISEVYGELHGAVSDTGARYFEREATITATGAASYALPDDHLSTIGIDRVVNAAGNRRELDELMVQERVLFAGQTGDAWLWAFTGTNIALYPTPASGTYMHIYVPQPTNLSSFGDGTSVDVINNDGLKFLVWGVASIALHKGEANQVRAVAERDRALQNLVAWAVRRAMTMPRRRVVRATDLRLQDGQFISPASWIYR